MFLNSCYNKRNGLLPKQCRGQAVNQARINYITVRAKFAMSERGV